MTTEIKRTIGLLRKLQILLPRIALITIYKAFIRSHLDYDNILYEQAFNLSLHEKLGSIQCRACLAITGGTRGISRLKIYQELGLESLQSRRRYRKLATFNKIYKNKSTFNLFKAMPERTCSYATRNVHGIPLIKIKHNLSKNFSFHIQSLNGTN